MGNKDEHYNVDEDVLGLKITSHLSHPLLMYKIDYTLMDYNIA